MKPECLNALIPRHKSDGERCRAVQEAGWPAVEPILPDLLEWLQDYNWPVAKGLAPFLAGIGAPLAPHIRRVLDTDDEIWKYWLLECLVKENEKLASALRVELQALASAPRDDEDRRMLAESAAATLARHRFL